MTTSSPFSSSATPILLLKTKSTPADGYDEFFSTHSYNPAFIPVLEHHFHEPNLQSVRQLFESGALNPGPERKYGGLIFTSQRAVEGFANMLKSLDSRPPSPAPVSLPCPVCLRLDGAGWNSLTNLLCSTDSITTPASHSLPLYTVGPATSRSLTTLRDVHLPHATVLGADSGTGEVLAHFILQHYPAFTSSDPSSSNSDSPATDTNFPGNGLKPLLFLVGEQRRDIIPKTLMNAPPDRRIHVDELIVYETGVMASFEREFSTAVTAAREYLAAERDAGERERERAVWVVVFSPTGCDAMVRALDLKGNGSGDGEKTDKRERIFVATIGPTTRDHLRENFGAEADVCAEKPSPEGVGEGIQRFMQERDLS
ncbi:uroporphyrinogen-III synthase HEM4 [Aspergillus affinis]|uniref:uroporphyrinogen-III synthase HEM4 n=1 Tax=Aspergillus affinis TaxID=1070780 RepID=UPI0022FDF8C0|nr:tetrapyrrole biosynthesis [Aspergillus affinis]KAI9036108.1 tetrapyrrole biosynthesis [Aspergillus affinis]